jgi:L-iditol 2-dehydrogenase
VAALGDGVQNFAVGDRVTFDSTVYCGYCDYCLRGEVNLCDNRQVVGVSCGDYRREGAFAEYVRVPEHIVYTLPDSLSFAEAAMLEAVSVALHAVRISGPGDEKTTLVVGAGMIGLLTLQAAKASGYGQVMIADVDATRLALAREVGADVVLHASGADLTKAVMEKTDGKGVDVVFEAVGRNETISVAIDVVRNITPEIALPLQKVVSRELRLQGSAASAGEYPQAIALMTSGRIRVKPLITAVAPLEDGPQWFARLHAREPNLMKVVLSPALGVKPA